MQLGAVTYNVLKDWDLETLITKLGELGYAAVELRTTHKHGVEPSLNQDERRRVRQRFERSRVRLLSYGTTCEFHSPDQAERDRQLQICKQFTDLAHETGALGIKVRPNAFPPGVPRETTIRRIGESLRAAGEYAAGKGVEIWLEVHGRETAEPPVCAEIMRVANHKAVGLCWNSNPQDIVNGSVRQSFDLLKGWILHVHINELAGDYPYRELFTLLRQHRYDRYTLCEAQASCEPERFLRWYKALWTELNRPCA